MNKFYAKYKARPNTTNIALPGWIVRFGAGIAAGKAEGVYFKVSEGKANLLKKINYGEERFHKNSRGKVA
ncbi:MAG: hypothetical protein GY907_02680 [Bacteroidetes bacterium]|nr:hypothetical protein [Bacteroidota bacterium]